MKSVNVAIAVITDKKGRILLTQRFDPTDVNVHMKWQLPGGGVEKGERHADACIREALEETGLSIELKTSTPHVIRKIYERREYILNGFKASVISGTIDVEKDIETNDCRWFYQEDINRLDLMDDTLEMIDACL